MTALPAGVRVVRDRVATVPYRPEGDQVTVGQTFAAGWLLARAAAGTLQVVTEVTGLLPGGAADRDFYQAAVSGDRCLAETGIFSLEQSALSGDAFVATDGPAPAYGIDNNTIGKLAVNPSTGAARSIVGLYLRLDAQSASGNNAIVWYGPEGVAMAQGLAAAQNLSTRDVCRGVFTAIDSGTTYASGLLTGPANTAISAQDGLTPAVGEVFYAQKGTTNLPAAAQVGPWQMLQLGSGSTPWIACRPWWYATGSTIPVGYTLKVGPGGTGTTPELANTRWKTFCAAGKVVDTDDPLFWPARLAGSYTASSGVVVNAVSTFPIRSTTLSSIKATNQGTAAHASTVGPPRVTAVTAGAIGTSALTMKAESAPGTVNASDAGVYTVEVVNWS